VLGALGEIRLFAGASSIPRGWQVCDGTLLQIRANQALFAILSTRYGGDGIQTFALPDLRGRAPVGVGTAPERPSYELGQRAGAEQIPTESVTVNTADPGTAVRSVSSVSGNNLQPVLGMNYIICHSGSFPSE
jgi:microcystin-dependent protein